MQLNQGFSKGRTLLSSSPHSHLIATTIRINSTYTAFVIVYKLIFTSSLTSPQRILYFGGKAEINSEQNWLFVYFNIPIWTIATEQHTTKALQVCLSRGCRWSCSTWDNLHLYGQFWRHDFNQLGRMCSDRTDSFCPWWKIKANISVQKNSTVNLYTFQDSECTLDTASPDP